MDYERRKSIDRTETGLLLLIISIVLGPIPILQFIGEILGIIGAILVILGRHPFGNNHSRNTLWSAGIFIIGLIIVLSFYAGFYTDVLSIAARSSTLSSAVGERLTSTFNNFVIGIVIGSTLVGFSNVLFTYALQQPKGRMLLWAAFGTGLAIEIALFFYLSSQTSRVIQDAVASGTSDLSPLDNLQFQIQTVSLLHLIPATLYAAAFYWARERIETGEIPETPASTLAP